MAAVSKDKVASEAWFLDTGCSNHMTGHKDWLIEFDGSKKSKVKLADNRSIQAEGTDMDCNLLSVGQLIEKGFSVTIKNENFELYDPANMLVLRTPLAKNRTFKTIINTTEVECMKAVSEEKQNWLWHLRFGHLNFKYLNQLVNKGMVTGLPRFDMPDKICDGCLVGKQPRNAFNKSLPMRSSSVLEAVHSDVCGPFDEKSLGGNIYCITFVDEYSRKM
ncbi:retrovirus-related pol polyprotein from transposon TNT 1-94 [Trifolium medium]|uniref:Retrovirus-related pol polyprotein from transposon TNT 1-94 n=1 Tax=Trifolium medium TaxID=97028 RepID=A0A392P1E6_9FABA|nr:retrovirus-related pol polyprotein from transposon TNT 1-94 [Trifolium medium]